MIAVGFKDMVERLRALKLPEQDLVIGLAWGGVVPAGLAAYQLGCDMRLMFINLRDEKNVPRYAAPKVLKKFVLPRGVKKVLIVDDVSVTGSTLDAARRILKNCRVKTLVLRGKADYVLFPEITECVCWPWKNAD